MKIKFWGVRGSIPTPITTDQLKEKLILLAKKSSNQLCDLDSFIKFIHELHPVEFGSIGGNTSCVEIQVNNKVIILDMGSGLKNLGDSIFSQPIVKRQKEFHIFLSHTHWDHISGLPFFKPANDSDTQIFIYSPLPDLEERLIQQQNGKFFPISFHSLKANINIITLGKNKPINLDGIKINNITLNHPGGCFGYKISHNKKSISYITDTSLHELSNFQKNDIIDSDLNKGNTHILDFLKNTNILVIDAMYGTDEIELKKHYGHSTAQMAVDIGNIVKADTIVLFHHDPDKNDIEITKMYSDTKKYFYEKHPDSRSDILLGYDDMLLEL